MRKPRTMAVLAVLAALLLGGGCGGDDDDGSSTTDLAGDDTDAPGATATTEGSTTTTSAAPARSDIEPCGLLSADELAAQASVAAVDRFEVERQEAAEAGRVAPGAFRCTHYFNVIDGGSEITATLAIEVRTKDAAGEYTKLHDFGSREREDVTGLGDKAFFDVENGSITVLAKGVVVIVDPGMPGVIAETNRPVAEAIAPIVLARL